MKYCCNPFNEPAHTASKRNSTVPKRHVSADLAANALQIGIHLTAGVSHICDSCARDIRQRFEAHRVAQLEATRQIEREARQNAQREVEQEARQEQERVQQRVQLEELQVQKEEQQQAQREEQRAGRVIQPQLKRVAYREAKREAEGEADRDAEQQDEREGELETNREEQQLLDRQIAALRVEQKRSFQEKSRMNNIFSDPSDIELVKAPTEEHGEQQLKTPGTSSEAEIELDKAAFVTKLNKLLPLMGVNKIDSKKIYSATYYSYKRGKLNEITRKLAKNIFEISPLTDEDTAEKNAGQEMLQQLKDEFAKTTEREAQIKILSVLPRSWSARRISNEFKISVHLVLHTKQLVDEHGIFCEAKKRMGTRNLPSARVKLIGEFFLQDGFSQVCPGKFDFVNVLVNNEKVKIQKRLLLMNLKEAHCQFKILYPDEPVGFSKFASMR